MWMFITAAALFVADYATKWVAVRSLTETPGGRVPIIPGCLDFFLQHNTGGAFSLFYEHPMAITVFSAAAILGIAYWSRKLPKEVIAVHIAFGLILGGALGNLLDRIRFQYVIDFIHIYRGEWFWPTFNIADSGIVVGIGIFLYLSLFTRKLEPAKATKEIAAKCPEEPLAPADANQ